MGERTWSLHFALSVGRWLLFLIPAAAPFAYVLHLLYYRGTQPAAEYLWLVKGLLLMDAIAILLLVIGIGTAIMIRRPK